MRSSPTTASPAASVLRPPTPSSDPSADAAERHERAELEHTLATRALTLGEALRLAELRDRGDNTARWEVALGPHGGYLLVDGDDVCSDLDVDVRDIEDMLDELYAGVIDTARALVVRNVDAATIALTLQREHDVDLRAIGDGDARQLAGIVIHAALVAHLDEENDHAGGWARLLHLVDQHTAAWRTSTAGRPELAPWQLLMELQVGVPPTWLRTPSDLERWLARDVHALVEFPAIALALARSTAPDSPQWQVRRSGPCRFRVAAT